MGNIYRYIHNLRCSEERKIWEDGNYLGPVKDRSCWKEPHSQNIITPRDILLADTGC